MSLEMPSQPDQQTAPDLYLRLKMDMTDKNQLINDEFVLFLGFFLCSTLRAENDIEIAISRTLKWLNKTRDIQKKNRTKEADFCLC